MRQLTAYCLDWHLHNSDAFIDMLVEPLKPWVNIKLTAWDGKDLPHKPDSKKPLIFCMLPPTEEILKANHQKIIWLPMWDQAQGYDQTWWNKLPKNVHVVCFSEQVFKKASAAGLPLIQSRYFKDPAVYRPVSWDEGYKVFYWNRTGLIGPQFLEKLCLTLPIKELLFLGRMDPRITNEVSYKLPAKIGSTKVTNLELTRRQEFLKVTARANIVIAPRKSEGVGMTFLEAMCRGCGVIAYDAPTMNEYIENGSNGLLLRNKYPGLLDKIFKMDVSDLPSGQVFYLSDGQPWSKIAKTDFEQLGATARSDHIQGHKEWLANLDAYANFVLS